MNAPHIPAHRTPAALTLCELEDPGVPGLESFSPFCLKVHRALRASGLAYVRRHGARPDEFARLNPTGQVPVLVGAEAISDSTEILLRLPALGGRSLVPEDPRARAEAWLYEELADTALNGFLVASRWADPRNWPAVREVYFRGMPAALRWFLPDRLRKGVIQGLMARDIWRAGPYACWTRFERTLDQLDARAPAEGFWVGDALSVADVGLFGQLHGLRNALTPWQRDQIAARPRLTAWLDRVDARTRPSAPGV